MKTIIRKVNFRYFFRRSLYLLIISFLLAGCEEEASLSARSVVEAGESWLAAAGTDKEAEETRKYLAELEEDIVSIDDLIGLAESEMGQKIFGENAKNVAEEGRQAKAAGAKYCFCDACKAVEAILSKKAEMLA